ncbi:MAG: hypothetical protein ACP5NS_03905 [Candidatus Pacearchaeota archaeon]
MRTRTALRILRDFQTDREIAYLNGSRLTPEEEGQAEKAIKTLAIRPYAHVTEDPCTIPDSDIAYAIEHGE